jgi:hypothetical protein
MEKQTMSPTPGPIAFFGSGETAPSGQKIFDALLKKLPSPPRISVVETPAGFELNSSQVARAVADFIQVHLQNYQPQIQLISARKKGTEFSPDNPDITLPILESNLIFMGPGSPTYAVRQLKNSLAWEYILTRHRQGAGLALSSAATIAISSSSLPVYEIYKVGQDLHWQPGLNLLSPYQLALVFIPHWNNRDGGSDLDTSRCYMGKSRFEDLLEMLSSDQVVVGIDEHTGLIIDFEDTCCYVIGSGTVTIVTTQSERIIPAGSAVELQELGDFCLPDPVERITPSSWEKALEIQKKAAQQPVPPEEVITWAEKRESARKAKSWKDADKLRAKIEERGWQIQDTSEGYLLEKR